MSFMQATAIISARDLASPVFARVAAAARAASGRYASAAGSFAAAGHKMHGALSMAVPTAIGMGLFGHDQYEWDKGVHQYRAIAELVPESMEKVSRAIQQTSNDFGVNKMELLDAAKGWQELGNSPESFIKNVAVAARTSRITGIDVAEQMKESSALMRAFGYAMDDAKMFKHFEEVYLVASKGMKGGAHAYGEAMQAWAPVAAGLGLTIEDASAFAQTLGGQFEASAIGNALKTGFLRLAAPVPKSEAMLRSQGIDRARLFRYDVDKLGNADSLINMLKGTGSFSLTPRIERMIRKDLSNIDLSKDNAAAELNDKLNEHLAGAFGNGKMSAQDRKILQASILNHLSSAATGLDPGEFFRVFGPLSKNLAFMSQVFGKEHAAKFMDLLKQWEHFSHNLEVIKERAEGALERKWDIFGEGFAFEWDRVKTAVDNFANSIGGSGIKGDLMGVFQSVSEAFRAAQDANPETLRALFWGIAGVAALAPAGYILSGIASSLTIIAGIAGHPIVLTIAGAYLFYEAISNWETLKKLAAEPLKFNVLFPDAPGWLKYLWSGAFDEKEQEKRISGTIQGTQGRPDWLNNMLQGPGYTSPYYQVPGDRPHSPGLRPLSLLDLSVQKVDVSGKADVTVRNELTVKVDGPGTVTNKTANGAKAEVPLNTGKGMTDTSSDYNYGGYSP